MGVGRAILIHAADSFFRAKLVGEICAYAMGRRRRGVAGSLLLKDNENKISESNTIDDDFHHCNNYYRSKLHSPSGFSVMVHYRVWTLLEIV